MNNELFDMLTKAVGDDTVFVASELAQKTDATILEAMTFGVMLYDKGKVDANMLRYKPGGEFEKRTPIIDGFAGLKPEHGYGFDFEFVLKVVQDG